MTPRYLPHLDGLRAIAVALVVLYHAGFDVVSAGYIGVDVFFVLSGFLITRQLIQQLDEGRFSFLRFYLRRIRRLAPALFLVSALTVLAGSLFLFPEELLYLSRLATLATLGVGNFYLANTSGGYFETDTDEIALLHTWSLAVEEQYYLLWPLLLILLWKLPGHAWRLAGVLVLLLASVAFSAWYTQADPVRAYYLLPARFHELLLGGLLAMTIQQLPCLGRMARELLGWLGLALVVVPALLWDAEEAFPGIRALLPCLGTALLIYAGGQPSILNRVLTLRAMIGLGLISYSLYLWHWPVFSLTGYVLGQLSWHAAALGIVVSVLLAYWTWRYVEKPFRFQWRASASKSVALLYVLPSLSLGAAAAVIYKGEGFIGRFGENARPTIEAMETWPSDFSPQCPDDPRQPCGDILLAGDSHAEHFADFISVMADDAGMDLDLIWARSCPIYPGLYHVNNGKINRRCLKHSRFALQQGKRYRYVVLAGFWSVSDLDDYTTLYASSQKPERSKASTNENITLAMRRAIRIIQSSGATPVIIYDSATTPDELYKCSRRNLMPFNNQECAFPRKHMDEFQADKRRMIRALAEEFPSLLLIDPTEILCDQLSCYTELEGLPLYRDDDHLNKPGSILIGKKYLERFGNPFTQ